MSVNTKVPQVDLRFYERSTTIAYIDAIRQSLIHDLASTNPNFKTVTSRELSIFLGRLQIFQEEKLGTKLNVPKKSMLPTKIPSKLFKVEATLTNESPIYYLLQSAYMYKISKKWKKWNWDHNVKDMIEMVSIVRNYLIEKGIIKNPVVMFNQSLVVKRIRELKKIVKKLGGRVTDKLDEATHIIHESNDNDYQDEDWFRTLEKKDGKVLVHWWYYPDSYDTWVEETSDHADPEPPPINNGPWNSDKGQEDEEEVEVEDEDEVESVKMSQESRGNMNEEEDEEGVVVDDDINDDAVSDNMIKKDDDDDEEEAQEASDDNNIVVQYEEEEDDDDNVIDIDNNYKNEEKSHIQELLRTFQQQKKHKLDDEVQETSTVNKTEAIQPVPSSKRPRIRSPEPKTISKISFIDIEEEALSLDLSRQKRNELDPILNGDVGNISYTFADNKTEHVIYGQHSHNIDDKLQNSIKITEINNTENSEKTNLTQGEEAMKKLYEEAREILSEYKREVIVPSYSEWFDSNKIHDIEKDAMMEFFNNKNKTKTSETYKKSRDFMINTYHLNPREYLTITTCCKNLPIDVDSSASSLSIRPLFTKNFNIKTDTPNNGLQDAITQDLSNGRKNIGISDSPCNSNIFSIAQNIYQPKINITETKNIFDKGKKPKIHTDEQKSTRCSVCSTNFTDVRYRSLKEQEFELCSDCYLEGRYPVTMFSGDFVRLEDLEFSKYKDNDWTVGETLSLIEGVELFGDDWNMVSMHVHTRSKEQCISHFLELPIEDPLKFTKDPNTQSSSSHDYIPFIQTDNPIMTMVTTLASAVNPGVAAAAAKSSIKDLNLYMKLPDNEKSSDINNINTADNSLKLPLDNNKSDDTDNSEEQRGIAEKVIKNAFDSAAAKAMSLAEYEEREIYRLINAIIDSQHRKLELKLQQIQELDSFVEAEKREIQRHINSLTYEQNQYQKEVLTLREQFNTSNNNIMSNN
ncbi:7062_t:CDS:2 [Entrophospora sp. SA101]|nr:7062_t:CDS:2 [Entrophospora sp. SA101]